MTRTRSRTERHRLQHIRRPPNTSVHKQLELRVREGDPTLFLELLDDLDEDFDPGAGEVELTTTVIGEHDAGEVEVVGFECILQPSKVRKWRGVSEG